MESTQEYLLRHGVRPSVQRLAVMNYLLTHHTHPTAEEIFRALSPEVPTLSKTTVYNTLKLLVGRGAVMSVDIDQRNERFDADTSVHAHFMCSGCGRIYDVRLREGSFPEFENFDAADVENVQILCRGLCGECRGEHEDDANAASRKAE